MKYEIHIGEVIELPDMEKKPKSTMIISEDQFAFIREFADVRRDSELRPIYKINAIEFTVYPHFEDSDFTNKLTK